MTVSAIGPVSSVLRYNARASAPVGMLPVLAASMDAVILGHLVP